MVPSLMSFSRPENLDMTDVEKIDEAVCLLSDVLVSIGTNGSGPELRLAIYKAMKVTMDAMDIMNANEVTKAKKE